jgi:hypothetical protein
MFPSQLPLHLVFVLAAVSIWKKYGRRDVKEKSEKTLKYNLQNMFLLSANSFQLSPSLLALQYF